MCCALLGSSACVLVVYLLSEASSSETKWNFLKKKNYRKTWFPSIPSCNKDVSKYLASKTDFLRHEQCLQCQLYPHCLMLKYFHRSAFAVISLLLLVLTHSYISSILAAVFNFTQSCRHTLYMPVLLNLMHPTLFLWYTCTCTIV